MTGSLNISVRVNEDAQVVIEGKSPDEFVRFEPVVLSRGQSLALAQWVLEMRRRENPEATV